MCACSFALQLKMRTGGVDPSRISKRKRSPKPRSKRTHQQPVSQLQEKPTTVSPVPEVAETTQPTPSSTEGFEHITCERLATTPAGAEVGGVVDIEKSFEVSPSGSCILCVCVCVPFTVCDRSYEKVCRMLESGSAVRALNVESEQNASAFTPCILRHAREHSVPFWC